MKLALGMEGGRVSFAIELYKVFNFKLLLLGIPETDRLMAEIHDNKLNDLLESIHQRIFRQRTIQERIVLIVEARKILASMYTTPSEEIFNKDHTTNDDRKLNDTTNTNKELGEIFPMSALDMKKMIPVGWTIEVFVKIVVIGIETPEVLLQYISHNTLSPMLKEHEYLTMNHSMLQILAEASPRFRTGPSQQYCYNQN